jgi:hypothetical protein
MHSPPLQVDRLAQATISVPLFVPLSTWFSGHTLIPGNTEGHKRKAFFIDVFYFVQENPEVKTAPEANALIH